MHHSDVAGLKNLIFSKDCGPSLSDCDAWRQWQHNGTAKPERRRRARKPSVGTLIKQAEKEGKIVTSVTVEGVTLTFGVVKENEANGGINVNPWDEVLN
jgi:hypothetical protein